MSDSAPQLPSWRAFNIADIGPSERRAVSGARSLENLLYHELSVCLSLRCFQLDCNDTARHHLHMHADTPIACTLDIVLFCNIGRHNSLYIHGLPFLDTAINGYGWIFEVLCTRSDVYRGFVLIKGTAEAAPKFLWRTLVMFAKRILYEKALRWPLWTIMFISRELNRRERNK